MATVIGKYMNKVRILECNLYQHLILKITIMKRYLFILFAVYVGIISVSCNNNINKNYFISSKSEYVAQCNLVFSNIDSLSKFDNIAIIDSFIILTDIYSDTIVRIYKDLDFSTLVFYAFKGNGPKDVIPPLCLNKAVYSDSIVIYEYSSNRLKKWTNSMQNFKADFLFKNIHPCREICVTQNYIISESSINNKIFIYNKETHNINIINYFLEPDRQYDDVRLKELHQSQLTVNEEKQSICATMFYSNCVNFFNFEGELQKTIIIGEKSDFPMPDTKYLFSVDSNMYFGKVCATSNYIYCLYAGNTDEPRYAMKIFVFNWDGEHITTIKINDYIYGLSANKNDEYILCLLDNERGSTDIVKIPLEGILKK
jgi:hypothetical protein